jgi:hypothetical protein
MIPNLRWLVPMAQNVLRAKEFANVFEIVEEYEVTP